MTRRTKPPIAVIWPSGREADAGLGQFYLRAFRRLGHSTLGASLWTVDPWTPRGKLLRRPYARDAHLSARIRHLHSAIRQHRAGLVLLIKGEDLTPSHVETLRSAGAPVVLYHPDSPIWILRPYDERVVEVMRAFDLVVTFARAFVPVFRQIGVRDVIRIPFAHDPATHRPVALSADERATYESALSYAGNTGPLQRYWLGRLGRFSPRAFGAGWDDPGTIRKAIRQLVGYGRYVDSLPGFGDRLAKVCAGARVVLNLVRAETNCPHSMKTFELPACGAAVVTNWTEEQVEFFPEGCAYFNTVEEAEQQIERLLGDPGLRESLRIAGLEEARAHTYEARATALLDYVQP